MLQQLRFGRGIDNRKFKATGFTYRYTTKETVEKLAEHLRLHPVLQGAQEPYRYEREVEDFLRWSPHVRNPSYRVESRLSPGEMVELQKLLSSYGERVGSPARGRARMSQSEDVARAAGAGAAQGREAEPHGGERARQPRERREDDAAAGDSPPSSAQAPDPAAPMDSRLDPEPREERSSASNGGAPVAHYDDLDADEIVGLLDSLEEEDLSALLEYERGHAGRGEVVGAIEGLLARRAAASES
jgi:hypothetical protein